MKKLLVVLLALAMVFAMTACGKEAADEPQQGGEAESEFNKVTLKANMSSTDTANDAIAFKKMTELVNERTNGAVTIEMYTNAQLSGGDMATVASLLSQGAYDLSSSSGSVLGNLDAVFLTHQLPFLFGSYADADKMLMGSGTEYYKKLLEEKYNITYIGGAMYNGIRHLSTSKTAVDEPADMKNLKIRVPNGEAYIKTLAAFGADPIAMSWSEVFTALQQGTIDGEENGYTTMNSNNIQEVQDYITEWAWSFDGFWMIANVNSWNKLNDATKEVIMKACEETSKEDRESMAANEVNIKKDFIDNYGITVIELSADQLQAFKDVATPVVNTFIDVYGAEACSAWGL